MGRVKDFLESLNERELAFFARYKKSTYLKETQEKIDGFLLDRGFSQEKIEELINSTTPPIIEDEEECCPRCGSDKLRKDKVEWRKTIARKGVGDEAAALDGLIGRATYRYEVVCNVCGLWMKDPNQEKRQPFFQRATEYIINLFSKG